MTQNACYYYDSIKLIKFWKNYTANLSWRKRIYVGKRMPIVENENVVENENEYANAICKCKRHILT
jgi:hypothetical protein